MGDEAGDEKVGDKACGDELWGEAGCDNGAGSGDKDNDEI